MFWVERTAAAAALVLAAPLLGAAMVGARLLSGRSPLVAHRRVGFGGEALWVWKVRTMWGRHAGVGGGWIERLDEPPVPQIKRGADPRVTSRFAAFCRRHSIDELPQLWHVVQGRMRLVGPRPMTEAEVETCYGADADEMLATRPGLTGLWQVMGRNRRTSAQRRRLDLLLVRRCSPRVYAWILWRTAVEVVFSKDAC